VSIDARNVPKESQHLEQVLIQLKSNAHRQCHILYLDAQDPDLLTRFSETRRKHPLTNAQITLEEGIKQEKLLLTPLSNMADIIIDSSQLSKHQLSHLIRERVVNQSTNQLQILIQSFGFKYGVPPDVNFIFDVRCLANPYWEPNLRHLTGLNKPVMEFLATQPKVNAMVQDIAQFLLTWVPNFAADNRSYLTIGIGCTGGQHRSVYIAQLLSKYTRQLNHKVLIRHRELNQPNQY
jgi:UPF0042 nucleotide-binding protein